MELELNVSLDFPTISRINGHQETIRAILTKDAATNSSLLGYIGEADNLYDTSAVVETLVKLGLDYLDSIN